MDASIFADCTDLDINFLNETYADDIETAMLLFHQFLDELPANLDLLRKSFHDYDLASFRKHLHKQKPGFAYVGLTHISNKIHELQSKCLVTLDLTLYKKEIEELLEIINRSSYIIEKAIMRLENCQ
jgi:hypothetical protein